MVDEKIKKAHVGGLHYEFIQLFCCMIEVRELNPDESKILVPNYLAVAFSTHARNLWEFFYASNKEPKKYPRVKHYIPNWDITPSLPIKKYYGVLNRQLSHLDYRRSDTKEPPPVAFIYEAYKHFRLLVNEFLDKVPKEILNPNFQELKEIVKQDMIYYP